MTGHNSHRSDDAPHGGRRSPAVHRASRRLERVRVLLLLPALCLLLVAGTCGTDREEQRGGDEEGRPRVVATEQGRVRSAAPSEGTYAFRGVPYAAAPLGDRRWRPPAPAAERSGVRDASRPGPSCVQPGPGGGPAAGSSEDCLHLNVVVPARRSAAPRPVVVWLHGGSFSTGSGARYGAQRMARTGDVVVVTVNSRLGAFGFFGHPSLPDGGVFGLQDQQAALRWIRANARAFGGDPGEVTLMGESTGGASVCAQLVSPGAKGLFHRAVVMSGACLQRWPKGVFSPGSAGTSWWVSRETLRERGREAAGSLGCGVRGASGAAASDDVAACLRAADPAKVVRLTGRFHEPAYGTGLLPEHPAKSVTRGAFHRVPVLQGSTRDEHRLFAAAFTKDGPMSAERYAQLLRTAFGAEEASRVLREYPPGKVPALAWAEVGTDGSWVCPTLRADELMARHVPVYSYEFGDRGAPGRPGDPGFDLGAYHASLLPYLFDVPGFSLEGEEQKALSARMLSYWTQFARTGKPGVGWSPYPTTWELRPGEDGPVDAYRRHHCGFWRTADGGTAG